MDTLDVLFLFFFLANVNSAAVNFGMHVCYLSMVFQPRRDPGVRRPGHAVALFVVFQGISVLLFMVTVISLHSPPKASEVFPFLHAISFIYSVVFF